MREKDDIGSRVDFVRDTAYVAAQEVRKILEDPEASPETKMQAASELKALARLIVSGGCE